MSITSLKADAILTCATSFNNATGAPNPVRFCENPTSSSSSSTSSFAAIEVTYPSYLLLPPPPS